MTRSVSSVFSFLILAACAGRPKLEEPSGPAISSPLRVATGLALQVPGSPGPVSGSLAPWAFFPVSPDASIERDATGQDVVTRVCEGSTPGTLLHVGETLTVFRFDEALALSLAVLSAADLSELRSIGPAGVWGQFTAIAPYGADGALLADLEGTVHAFSAGQTRVFVRPAEETADWDVDRIWTSRDAALVARSRFSRRGQWYAVERGGTSASVATGGVQRCGQPLVDGRALAISGKRVALLDLDARRAPEVIAESPLHETLCAAGSGGLIAITGRVSGAPTLALHDAAGWHLVTLPPSGELFEPWIHAERVIVAAPRATLQSPNGTPIAEAGVVHIVDKQRGAWALRERLVARSPGRRGLFGFVVGTSDEALYVSEMVPGLEVSPSGKARTLGQPMTCRAPWTP